MSMGPKTTNGGAETGYNIADAQRWLRKWAIIVGSVLTLGGTGGGIVGTRMFSQSDVDAAEREMQQDMRIGNIEQNNEWAQIKLEKQLDRFEELIIQLGKDVTKLDERTKDL